jgi:hypothetical protein
VFFFFRFWLVRCRWVAFFACCRCRGGLAFRVFAAGVAPGPRGWLCSWGGRGCGACCRGGWSAGSFVGGWRGVGCWVRVARSSVAAVLSLAGFCLRVVRWWACVPAVARAVGCSVSRGRSCFVGCCVLRVLPGGGVRFVCCCSVCRVVGCAGVRRAGWLCGVCSALAGSWRVVGCVPLCVLAVWAARVCVASCCFRCALAPVRRGRLPDSRPLKNGARISDRCDRRLIGS